MQDVFVHAQIVLATLNSSLNGQMEHQARFMSESSPTKRPFEVAIVDEASQSVEPEMLIPMQVRPWKEWPVQFVLIITTRPNCTGCPK